MKRQNLDEEVYEIVLRQIMNGEYNSGEKIRVDELASELEVSITPVLSALPHLVYDGLVMTKRGNGFVLADFDEEDFRKILDVHNNITIIACQWIVDHDLEESVETLQELADQTLEAFESGSYTRYRKYDDKFHETIIHRADNPFLLDFYKNIYRKLCYCYQMKRPAADRGIGTAKPQNHKKICQALLDKDFLSLREILINDFEMETEDRSA